jgi:DNA polymerase-1
MQVRGVGFDPNILSKHGDEVRARMASCEQRAHGIAGRAFNLGSSQQLSEILFNVLKLPEPEDRTATKKQASTDETALRALATRHALPGLVLEYRQLQNLQSKWVEADWVVDAGRRASRAGTASVRCHCDWNQTSTATGRLSSSGPNLQAVTKYTVEMPRAEGATEEGGNGGDISINIRDSFIASAGGSPTSECRVTPAT